MNQFLSKYKLLSKIDSPKDLKKLTLDELITLSDELRSYIIETTQITGGHLASSLGVIDLTIALHAVFNTPEDKLVWDVGHQAYGHKILTGRKEEILTIRQYGGISGFCKISESEYDTYGAGHASTSISAALGLASARDMSGESERIVAIIGDGALTGGLAYEGLNNADKLKGQFLVILNDNRMSISRNVGAMSNYLTRIVTHPKYLRFKTRVWDSLSYLPKGGNFARKIGRKFLESLKNILAPGIVFEEFGFRYYGPIDGHDLGRLIETLNRIKDFKYPVLLHVITQKGKGLASAENDPTKYHGISPKSPDVKEQKVTTSAPPFLKVLGETSCEIAEKNNKAVFITAAMADGTGLVEFSNKFPKRYFDVGIAEGHAVTFAAGLAVAGYRPVVAIYSTFLQRAYDHIIHDVALQNLPVIFALDRAGLVGEDGPTHHGAFDLSYLNCIPNMIISAPRNGTEFRNLLFTAFQQNEYPFAIRYPKESCSVFENQQEPTIYPVGKWEILNKGSEVAVVSVGILSNAALDAVSILRKKGIDPTIVHARFVKPIDHELLNELARTHQWIFTLEENSLIGGFGSTISRILSEMRSPIRLVTLGIPDEFIEQGTREILIDKLGLNAEGIARSISGVLSQ
ncbi:MAG: 1-deoxy-D-xylulose-5-phosphate synthase [Candidatus Marinimicrobia bacterium CG08_land_8_20_14_0_20_45_22]|nr:MAG: 1-deoxy-D-xylulose-5-phosphate synthase [Candidatus Marinimicrobia bacterium CG08_land_8_20_14_0_20_45_22]